MNPSSIRSLRHTLGESQAEFGKRFEVSQITVGYWESGRSQPARQRLAELASLASTATSVRPKMHPFRPIQYLGSKQRLAETIVSVLENIAPGGTRVGDMFSGSGVVSALLGASRPVTAIDIQAYSEVLSTALLLGGTESFAALVEPEFLERAQAFASKTTLLFAPLIELENRAMCAAAQGNPEQLIEIIEFGSMAARAQRPTRDTPRHLAKLLDAGISELAGSGIPPSHLVTLKYFGGPYFAYQQAIWLDAIYAASKTGLGPSTENAALAVLLSVASEVVNTVGKQFAQPMKLRKSDGSTPKLLLHRAIRDRTMDVMSVYRDWAKRWMGSVTDSRYDHRFLRGDVIDIAAKDRECAAWYADPPYTIDHYSRFYHVLETMTLRDSPSLAEMRKHGAETTMRGLYRAGRFQSQFCVPSQAHAGFNSLFATASMRGAPLVLSYSPFDDVKGNRPRLLSLKEMVAIASAHYKKVTVLEVSEHSHRKLNSKSANKAVRGDAERLLICEARK